MLLVSLPLKLLTPNAQLFLTYAGFLRAVVSRAGQRDLAQTHRGKSAVQASEDLHGPLVRANPVTGYSYGPWKAASSEIRY